MVARRMPRGRFVLLICIGYHRTRLYEGNCDVESVVDVVVVVGCSHATMTMVSMCCCYYCYLMSISIHMLLFHFEETLNG